jgi:hypothetical protein
MLDAITYLYENKGYHGNLDCSILFLNQDNHLLIG